MTCDVVEPLLPLLAYGDVPDEDRPEVRAHLARCARCAKAFASFQKLQQRLNNVPAPEVTVEPLRVLQLAAEQQARTARRWKRITAAAIACAACLAFVLVVRPEVSVQDGAFVVRWKEPPTPVNPPAPPPALVNDPEQLRKLELLMDLVRGFAETSEDRDRERLKQLEALRLKLELTQLQVDNRRPEPSREIGPVFRMQPRKDDNE